MYKYEIDIDNNYTYRSKYHHLTYGHIDILSIILKYHMGGTWEEHGRNMGGTWEVHAIYVISL